MIYELLQKGKENAVSTVQLMNATGICSERELRRVIAAEREAGRLIVSTRSGSGGYYIPGTREEIVSFVKETEKSIYSLRKSMSTAQNYLKSLGIEGQISLPGTDQLSGG